MASEETFNRVPVFYVLVCRECGDGEDALPMPFASAADRGHWAAEHTRGTGHDRWFVIDEPAAPQSTSLKVSE